MQTYNGRFDVYNGRFWTLTPCNLQRFQQIAIGLKFDAADAQMSTDIDKSLSTSTSWVSQPPRLHACGQLLNPPGRHALNDVRARGQDVTVL
jgi:hypothetical protein